MNGRWSNRGLARMDTSLPAAKIPQCFRSLIASQVAEENESSSQTGEGESSPWEHKGKASPEERPGYGIR